MDRVLRFSPVVGTVTPPPPHLLASLFPLPLVQEGGTHTRLRDRGWGGQFRRGDRHCCTLGIYVLCVRMTCEKIGADDSCCLCTWILIFGKGSKPCLFLQLRCQYVWTFAAPRIEQSARRMIRLIEGNAKCRHLKKLTCTETLWQVFICLRPRTQYPLPPLHV
jgi:hypothetical protein